MDRWLETPLDRLRANAGALDVYLDRRLVAILLLGFSSGLPLALTFGTLTFWLAEAGVDKAAIGLFALVGIAYGWKFVWAPVVDHLSLPLLTRLFGRRRGWILLCQLGLIVSIAAMGASDPAQRLWVTALLAVLVAFCSASQDIVIDAYRVELLEERQQGAGAAVIVIGYRIAMLVSGAGALFLADFAGWLAAYLAMAALMLVGIATVLLSPEPTSSALVRAETRRRQPPAAGGDRAVGRVSEAQRVDDGADHSPVHHVLQARRRPARRDGQPVLRRDGLLEVRGGLGGQDLRPVRDARRRSARRPADQQPRHPAGALWICGVLQILSNLMFAVQAYVGHDVALLTMTIAARESGGRHGDGGLRRLPQLALQRPLHRHCNTRS